MSGPVAFISGAGIILVTSYMSYNRPIPFVWVREKGQACKSARVKCMVLYLVGRWQLMEQSAPLELGNWERLAHSHTHLSRSAHTASETVSVFASLQYSPSLYVAAQ